MKKVFVIMLAFVLSFLLSEIISSNILSYPKAYPSSSYRINYLLNDHSIMKIKSPFYKFIDSEGGIKIIEYNNIGLPGPEIDTNIKEGYIFLIGNSFVEANTILKNDQASTKLNYYLKSGNISNQVINLGISTGDPYVQWFRVMFFEKYYKPSIVVFSSPDIPTLSRRITESVFANNKLD